MWPTRSGSPRAVPPTTLDPVIVAQAFGVRRGTVLHYLADTIDPGRLANL